MIVTVWSERIQAVAAAGIDELVVEWFGVDNPEGLEILATEVRPRLAGTA